MIRVGVLCDHLDLGGQELGCLEVVRRLDRARFDPLVYAFRPGSLLEEFRAAGVPVVLGHDKPGSDTTWTERDRAAQQSYRELLSTRLSADAIDVVLVYAWRDGVAVASELGVPIVERIDGPGLVRRIADKSACRRIICESASARDALLAQRQLVKCDRKRIVVIRNGIDLRRFDAKRYDRAQCRAALGLREDDFVIGAVTRLGPEKNLTQLVRATAELITERRGRSVQSIRLVLAGPDAGDEAVLRREARDAGILDQVIFLGPRRDVPEVLRALDVFALTSLTEGAPFALIEAMAMGLPIVATPVGAIPETIDGNGYLASPLDPHETMRALAELLRDSELRTRLGRRSRTLARRHDLERMIPRYEAVLVEALDEARFAREQDALAPTAGRV